MDCRIDRWIDCVRFHGCKIGGNNKTTGANAKLSTSHEKKLSVIPPHSFQAVDASLVSKEHTLCYPLLRWTPATLPPHQA
jgi:hypothetical protein